MYLNNLDNRLSVLFVDKLDSQGSKTFNFSLNMYMWKRGGYDLTVGFKADNMRNISKPLNTVIFLDLLRNL